MNVQIIHKPFSLNLHGFSGTALNKDYAGTAFRLSDQLWKTVKAKGIKNKGLNVWVYEPGDKVFAGVELDDVQKEDTSLEHKIIHLENYAYYRHTGPYHLLKQVGQAMRNEINSRGFESCLPHVEIYGHWSADEAKLETELLMCLK